MVGRSGQRERVRAQIYGKEALPYTVLLQLFRLINLIVRP